MSQVKTAQGVKKKKKKKNFCAGPVVTKLWHKM